MYKSILSASVFVFLFISIICPLDIYSTGINKDELAESLYRQAYELYMANNNDSSLIAAKKLLNYSELEGLVFHQGKACYQLGKVYASKGVYDSSNYYFRLADDKYALASDTLKRGETNVRMAFNYKTQGKTDEAIFYYSKALDLLDGKNDTLWYIIASDHLGNIYRRTGNYYEAIEHLQNAIWASKLLNNIKNVGIQYNSIGLVYRKAKNKEKEKQAYLNAIATLSGIDESTHLADAYSNLSELYLEEGLIEKGFEALEKSRQIALNFNYSSGLCGYYAVLAFYYDNLPEPNYVKVIDYASKGAAIALEHESYQQYADAQYYLGKAYLNSNKLNDALNSLLKGFEIAEKYQYLYELERISGVLSNVYKKLNRPEKALFYLEEHLMLKDSLSGEERIKEFTSLDLSFKFKQESYRDSLAQSLKTRELVFNHEKEIQVQYYRQLALAFVIIAIVIFVVFIIILARKQKSQNLILDEKNKIINKSLHEKELLLKEIHHRVKNNFQTVSSLLDLQSKEVSDAQALINIEEGQSRIRSMALIHQKLYQKDNLASIDFQDYTDQLARQLAAIYALANLEIRVEATGVTLDIDTSIPLGLILNELITNACKYAFKTLDKPKLSIRISRQDDDFYVLYVQDNGKGLPADLDLKKVKSLGLRLVGRLSKQLQGKFEYEFDKGSKFCVLFKDAAARRKVD